jgi:hypothetical protein
MDETHRYHSSHLFTVRLWAEDLGSGQAEWRGRVQHVSSGEARYFRDWPTLVALLLAMLRQGETRHDAEATAPAAPEDR